MEQLWLDLTLMGFLFVASAFFSGSETALLAMDRTRVSYLVEKNRRGAQELAALLGRPEWLLGGILVGNNLVNIALSVIATGFFVRLYGVHGEWLTIVVLTPLLLIISEVCPKTYAARRSERLAFKVLTPIRLILTLLSPATWLVTRFSLLMTRLLKADQEQVGLSADEIQTIIALGARAGALPGEQHSMLHGVFELGQIRVRDVMIPRTEVVGVSVAASYGELFDQIKTSPHSRFPVYDGSLDNIVGVVHAKDVLHFIDQPQAFDMRSQMREPYFVPESKLAQALLQAFRRRRVHLAVVIDEYGGVEGIVTLEDVLEEIVGEIQDEYDAEEPYLTALAPGQFLVEGGTPLRLLRRRFGVDFAGEEATTLAGLMLCELGRIPQEGDRCEVAGLTLIARKVELHRIEQIEILLPEN